MVEEDIYNGEPTGRLGRLQYGAFEFILECTHNLHATELVHELLPQYTFTIRVIHEPHTTTTIYIHIDECAVER